MKSILPARYAGAASLKMLKILLRDFLLKPEDGLWAVCCGKGKHCKENPQVYFKAFVLLGPRLESYSHSQLRGQE